ncbi:MAG: Crp/Fnr family transcriptional regulator [Betaproteobacteria bacterium]|nr:Crp/Fnr family transcriptional regulator [Betaproteobacteria bacterium]
MPTRAQPHIRLVTPAADPGLIGYLRHHRVFGVLPHDALQQVAAVAHHRTYLRGQHLYVEGEPTSHVYVVRSGLVVMAEADDRGSPRVVITYAADDVSGSMCATLGMVHQCTATALVDSEVLHLPKSVFDSLYEKYPKLGLRVLEEVNHIVRRSRRMIMALTLSPITARVASFLLSVPAPSGETAPKAARVELSLSHQDLALLLGTSRESVTRVLDRLAADGIIAVSRRCIEILDSGRLKRLIEN